MDNKASIELWINGIRVYTRKVMAHKKYTHAMVSRANPVRISNCSSTGKFEDCLMRTGRVLPVQWTDARTATVWVTASKAECDEAIDYCEKAIVVAHGVGNVGAVADYQGYINTWRKVRAEAEIEVDGAGVAPEVEEAPTAKRTKKAMVSTETPEKMMQRFAGQCREMIRKIGYEKAMDLIRYAEDTK